MKKLILICIGMITIISCKKEKAPVPATTPTSTPATMNSYELELEGNWILRTTDTYGIADTLLSHEDHSDSISCHLDLRSTQTSTNQSISCYDCTYALGCTAHEAGWKCPDGVYITLAGGTYYIMKHTTDSLVLKSPGSAYYISTLTK